MEQAAPGVWRHGLEVATLGFRVKRSKSQGGLSGCGDFDENHKGVTRDFKRNILEIVLASSANADGAPSAPGPDLCLLSTCASIVVLFGPCGFGPILGKCLLIVVGSTIAKSRARMASRSR